MRLDLNGTAKRKHLALSMLEVNFEVVHYLIANLSHIDFSAG